jgi:hypothetical protein
MCYGIYVQIIKTWVPTKTDQPATRGEISCCAMEMAEKRRVNISMLEGEGFEAQKKKEESKHATNR